MKITTEMVLQAERCTGMQYSPSEKELRVIHVVPDGDYEQPVLCFYCDERYWKPKSQDSYWDYWDSSLMLAQIQIFTNEKALKLLEEMNAFDCPCTGFEMFDNVMK